MNWCSQDHIMTNKWPSPTQMDSHGAIICTSFDTRIDLTPVLAIHTSVSCTSFHVPVMIFLKTLYNTKLTSLTRAEHTSYKKCS